MTCVIVAHYLNYTIEDVLDHTPKWINAMTEIVNKIEFEKNLTQLSMHGVSKEDIERLRQKFEMNYMTDKEKENIAKNELNMLRRLGGHVGKKSKTKVIR